MSMIECDQDDIIKPYFKSCIKLIDRNLSIKNIAINFQTGVLYSGVVVIIYFMWMKGSPYPEAKSYIRG
jgi:hypothetical protein